jgi:hypothetical protein
MAGLEPAAACESPPGRRTVTVVRARRRRYLSARTVISLVALASLVVPGIVAVIAAAVSAF